MEVSSKYVCVKMKNPFSMSFEIIVGLEGRAS